MQAAWSQLHRCSTIRSVAIPHYKVEQVRKSQPMTNETWQQLLVQKHPQLFIRSFRGLPFSPGYPVCPDGWCEAVTRMVERISEAATGYSVYFRQISEQHGRLTIYWKAETNLPRFVEGAIDEAIELAEARSACTCASCGAKGSLFSSGSCLFTACPDHARGVAVPIPGKMKGVHIVRAFVGDKLSVACRRYDWIHDKFVDIDPGSFGIGDWHKILAHVGNLGHIQLGDDDPIEAP
jgi:hypothetical protein